MIVTIARQYGSGGRAVGEKLGKLLGVPVWGKAELMAMSAKTPEYETVKAFYEEQPIDSLLYAIAISHGSDSSAAPFRQIRVLTEGRDFVLVGRCGNYIFKDAPDAVSVFIHADSDKRAQRVAAYEGISAGKAKRRTDEVDKERADFHRYYTHQEWGLAENYELCIDSGVLGVDGAAEMLADYLRRRNANG